MKDDETLPRHAIDKLARLAGEARSTDTPADRYDIIRQLGRGGMGVVYEAQDRTLGRRVALKKLLLPHGAPPELFERFRREALAAARLCHPNIATVYDADGESIAMQLVVGHPMSEIDRSDRRRIVRLIRDAALAIHHAHEHGIVHRDVKPQNLLVENDRVLVTDFGLAKELAEDASLSISGHILGTPSYMAPEQASGRVHDVDARTDVWGLGATLYDLLCGRPPYVGADVGMVLRRISETEPPLPRRLVPDLPRDLEVILRKCLEKDPKRRYVSANALAKDLDAWIEARPIDARPPSPAYLTTRFVARHRALVSTASLALAGFVVALIVIGTEGAKREAAARALKLSESVANVLDDARTLQRQSEVDAANEVLDRGIATCRSFIEQDDVALAHFLLGRLLRARGDGDGAEAAVARALELDADLVQARMERGLLLAARSSEAAARRAAAGENAAKDEDPLATRARADLSFVRSSGERLRRIDALHVDAELARLEGDLGAAKRLFQQMLENDPVNVPARVALSRLSIAEGDGDAALRAAMAAMDVQSGLGQAYVAQSGQAVSPSSARALAIIERAISQHRLAAAEQRIASGDESSAALERRGNARYELDDIDGAMADFSAALETDPNNALAYGSRGLIRSRQASRLQGEARYDEALDAWRDAADDFTHSVALASDDPSARSNRGIAHLQIAQILEARDRDAEAQREFELARADIESALESRPEFALARLNRAILSRLAAERAMRENRWSEARASLQAAAGDLDRASSTLSSDESLVIEVARLAESELELATSEHDTNVGECARRARAAWDAAVQSCPESPRARGMRGLFHLRAGRKADAKVDLEGALRALPSKVLAETFKNALQQL